MHPCGDGTAPMVPPAQGTLGMRSPVPCWACSPPTPQPTAAVPSLLHSPLRCQEFGVPAWVLTSTPGLGVRSECCRRRTRPCRGVSCFFVSRRPHVFPAVFELLCGGGVPAPPPSHPQQGPGAPLAPASWELVSGLAVIGAGDPRGLTSCNLAFTRLRVCKGLNEGKPNLLKGACL